MAERTVLIIEDNEINMKLVRSLLQIGKCQVLEAGDAGTGIQLAREHRPDLILMDIQLPGMDGFQATRVIKEDPELKHTPVLALTAHAMKGDDQKAREAGCDGYISKPIDTRAFLERIASFFPDSERDSKSPNRNDREYRNLIMIVDDEPLNVKVLTAKLSSEKYEITAALNGHEALQKAVVELPDLILLDIMMPDMDGYEVARRLKRDPRTDSIPIIMVTALDGTDDKVKALEAGAEEFLNKPVHTIELLARVQSMLRLKQYKDQLTIQKASEAFFNVPLDQDEPVSENNDLPMILLLEDNEKDVRLIQNHLYGEPYEIILAEDGKEAFSLINEKKIDLVLLDILLPDMDGFEVCRRIKEMEQTRDIQVVMITCLHDLDSKVKGIEIGTDDYLIKPIDSRELKARVKTLLKKKAYLDILRSNYEIALNSAMMDGLTELYNQAYFKRFLDLEVRRSNRYHYPIALVMFDIDDFKGFNDTMGHLAGDDLLKELAQVLKKNVRNTDLVTRYGGDEFSIVLPYINRENAVLLAKRIRESIATHTFLAEGPNATEAVTVSVGIALCPDDASAPEVLIQKADEMLYKAKKHGKDQVCAFEHNLEKQGS